MKSVGLGAAFGRSRVRAAGADPSEAVLARFDVDAVGGAAVARCLERHPRLLPALTRLRDRIEQEFGGGCGAVLAAVEGARGGAPVGLLVAVRVAWCGPESVGSYQRLSAWWRRHAPRAERERIALGIIPGPPPANDNAG